MLQFQGGMGLFRHILELPTIQLMRECPITHTNTAPDQDDTADHQSDSNLDNLLSSPYHPHLNPQAQIEMDNTDTSNTMLAVLDIVRLSARILTHRRSTV